MKYIGYSKIASCKDIASWIYWATNESDGMFERFFGFEFKHKVKEKK